MLPEHDPPNAPTLLSSSSSIETDHYSMELLVAKMETRLQTFVLQLMKPSLEKVNTIHEQFCQVRDEHAQLRNLVQDQLPDLQKTVHRNAIAFKCQMDEVLAVEMRENKKTLEEELNHRCTAIEKQVAELAQQHVVVSRVSGLVTAQSEQLQRLSQLEDRVREQEEKLWAQLETVSERKKDAALLAAEEEKEFEFGEGSEEHSHSGPREDKSSSETGTIGDEDSTEEKKLGSGNASDGNGNAGGENDDADHDHDTQTTGTSHRQGGNLVFANEKDFRARVRTGVQAMLNLGDGVFSLGMNEADDDATGEEEPEADRSGGGAEHVERSQQLQPFSPTASASLGSTAQLQQQSFSLQDFVKQRVANALGLKENQSLDTFLAERDKKAETQSKSKYAVREEVSKQIEDLRRVMGQSI
ncbi:unnamed protein product, partial [Amoebophrya sp. A120]|eukprot:GSA120T00018774001.1